MNQASDLEDRAAELLALNRPHEAAQLISDAIAESGESSSLWNDWAVIQYAAGEYLDAERALRRALQLDSRNIAAAENLGALFYSQGKKAEAMPFLELALAAAEGPQRELIARLIAECPRKTAAEATVAEGGRG